MGLNGLNYCSCFLCKLCTKVIYSSEFNNSMCYLFYINYLFVAVWYATCCYRCHYRQMLKLQSSRDWVKCMNQALLHVCTFVLCLPTAAVHVLTLNNWCISLTTALQYQVDLWLFQSESFGSRRFPGHEISWVIDWLSEWAIEWLSTRFFSMG